MIRARLLLLSVTLTGLSYLGVLAADAVPLRAGQVAPFDGVLQSVQLARGVRAKLAALVELRAALDARSVQVTALTSANALLLERSARYKAEADRATQAATIAGAKARTAGTKGFVAGASVGALVFKVIGWILRL